MVSGVSLNSFISGVFGRPMVKGPRGSAALPDSHASQGDRTGAIPEVTDIVEISSLGRATARAHDPNSNPAQIEPSPHPSISALGELVPEESDAKSALSRELTGEEQEQTRELKKRDREVRTHEQAHLGAAGQFARGGASFEYETGPDGRQYAVGGEVQIDTAPVPDDPQATIQKMQQVRRAALAPAKPSAQDRKVAAQAAAAEREASAQLAEQRRAEQEGSTEGAPAQASPLAPNPSPGASADPDLARRYISHDEPGSALDLTV